MGIWTKVMDYRKVALDIVRGRTLTIIENFRCNFKCNLKGKVNIDNIDIVTESL